MAIAPHLRADGGGGHSSFTFLHGGFTQELFGVSGDLGDPDDFPILGGVAFAPNGDVWSSECLFYGTRLHRFHLNQVEMHHGTAVHPEEIVSTQGGCGLTNHPDGAMYSNSSQGIWKLNANSGLPIGDGPQGPGGNGLGIAVDPQADLDGNHHLVYVGSDCHPSLNMDPDHPSTTCTIWDLNPATNAVGVFARLPRTDLEFFDGIYFDPSGDYLFGAHRDKGETLVHNSLRIIHRPVAPGDATMAASEVQLVQDVPMPSEPDGVAFHATHGFVITLNESGDCRTPGGLISAGHFTIDPGTELPSYCADDTDTSAGGTITRFDFPGGDYSATPEQTEFASGGFRGDLLQVGADGCVYATQGALVESGGTFGVRYSEGSNEDSMGTENSIVKICGEFAVPPGVSAAGEGKIGDYVWNDENQNGLQDSGEPGLDGVTMTLTGDGLDQPLTTTTHDGGQYTFAELKAGTYHVAAATLPVELDLVPTASGAGNPENDSNSNPATVTLADNTSQDLTIDFGFHARPASLTGFAYVDANRNHTMDEDEDTIPFVQMTLGGQSSDTQLTDFDGSFLFTDLAPGSYTVSAPAQADGKALFTTSPLPQTLAANQHATGLNFGYVPGRLSGFAYVDANRNGAMDAGDVGIGNVTITLDIFGVPMTTTTALDGSYTFDDLDGGDYEVLAPATEAGKNRVTASPQAVSLAAGEDHPNVNFGYVPGSISGFAYVDANRNSVKDSGEAVLGGVQISLGAGGTATTATDGSYIFTNLSSGNQSVSAPGTASGKLLFTASPLTVPLGPGQAITDVNFGYVPGSISGYAYVDNNNNGTKDAGEPGIGSVAITLTGTGSTVLATVTAMTASDGSYSFTSLDSGTYSDVAPSSAGGRKGSTPSPLGVALTAGQALGNVNFGYVPGSISGYAYVDSNNNGARDPGEPGLGNVTITRGGLTSGTATTASDGSYTFSNLLAGSYTASAPSTASGKNRSTASPLNVALAAGEARTNVNFGYVPGSISGFAYADWNNNGIKDASEPGLGSVAITLAGVTPSASTASNGSYSFAGLNSGTYSVSAPSNAAGLTRSTASPLSVNLAAGENRANVNFGYRETGLPLCSYVIQNGPPTKVIFTVQDTLGGLKSIQLTQLSNFSAVIAPPSGPATTSLVTVNYNPPIAKPVTLTATRINGNQSATVDFKATDAFGNVLTCDPTVVTVGSVGSLGGGRRGLRKTFRENGKDELTVVENVPEAEHYITVRNNTPGLTRVDFWVNQVAYHLRDLVNGQVVNLDIAEAMRPGTNNRIVIVGRGRPNGTAEVTIADVAF